MNNLLIGIVLHYILVFDFWTPDSRRIVFGFIDVVFKKKRLKIKIVALKQIQVTTPVGET